MRALVVASSLLFACQSWNAPYENPSQTVDGCNEAVAHLRKCCPAWDSFLSCTYMSNTIGSTDLTPNQSRCISKMPCDELGKTVTGSTYLCGMTLPTHHCK